MAGDAEPFMVAVLEPLTPTWTGGYNTYAYSEALGVWEVPVRPTEVKGVVRWAARLLALSAAYMLIDNVQVGLDRPEEAAKRAVREVFGGVSTGRWEGRASPYVLRVGYEGLEAGPEQFGGSCRDRLFSKYRAARCKWLRYKAVVSVRRFPQRFSRRVRALGEEGLGLVDEFVARSFVVGMLVKGVGKGVTRRYGSFSLELEGDEIVGEVYESYKKVLAAPGSETAKELRRFINEGIEAAARLLLRLNQMEEGLEKLESLSEEEKFTSTKLYEYPNFLKPAGMLGLSRDSNIDNKLVAGLFIDYERNFNAINLDRHDCILCSRVRDPVKKFFCDIIFGLPRNKPYNFNVDRLPSSVMFRALKNEHDSAIYTFIYKRLFKVIKLSYDGDKNLDIMNLDLNEIFKNISILQFIKEIIWGENIASQHNS